MDSASKAAILERVTAASKAASLRLTVVDRDHGRTERIHWLDERRKEIERTGRGEKYHGGYGKNGKRRKSKKPMVTKVQKKKFTWSGMKFSSK